jgi:Fic family protein
VGGWDWEGPAPTERDVRMAQNSLRLAARIVELVERFASSGLPSFTIDRALLLELHAITMAGESYAGELRTTDVQIGSAVVLYEPPSWQHIDRHVDDMLARIDMLRTSGAPTLNVAAYALWRICWIHPFVDGNGRTARAIAYAVLCVGFGRVLPGTPTVPELIAMNRYPYWDALKAADEAWSHGELDVSGMEQLLAELVERQMAGVE